MIDSARLLEDLKKLVRTLEADLREEHDGSPRMKEVEAEWREATEAKRTAETLADFRAAATSQSAAHWVLACVFLRFVEDNVLVERPWLAGQGERMTLARDRHQSFFRHPDRRADSDLDYLLDCLADAARLPGMAGLFDRRHNPLFRLPLSGDGAEALLRCLRRTDPDTGGLVHDFRDPARGTRFLGDL
jgi:hypothetical protein